MNTKLLKQKILDLAIRGKLTQQLKSDGTARELLEQISSKVSSSSSTLSSPRRRGSPSSSAAKTIIPLDKSDAPFEIPANWEWVRLGDVAYIASGSTPSKDCFVERGVPYLKMYNLRNQQIDFEYKPQYIKREIHEGKLARSKAKPGDVIMNIVGPPLGKVAIVPESLPECNFNQAAVLIRAHFCTNLMNQYIRYFLLQMDEINAINTKGTAGQENISLTQTQNMRLPLPPLAEQQRIVAKIEEAFAEIDAIEKNKELLKTHIKQARQKILDLAIHGRLVPQNKNDEPASVLLERITRDNPHYEKLTDAPFEIPDSWEWVKLGDVAYIASGSTPSKEAFVDNGIPYLKMYNLRNQQIDFEYKPQYVKREIHEGKLARSKAKPGDVIMNIVGPPLGKVALVPESLPECNFNQAAVLIRALYSSNLMNQYIRYFLLQMDEINAVNTKGTAGQENISLTQTQKMRFPLPPLAEQKRIVDRIEEIFASLDEISLHLV